MKIQVVMLHILPKLVTTRNNMTVVLVTLQTGLQYTIKHWGIMDFRMNEWSSLFSLFHDDCWTLSYWVKRNMHSITNFIPSPWQNTHIMQKVNKYPYCNSIRKHALFVCDIHLCVKVDLYRAKNQYGKRNTTGEEIITRPSWNSYLLRKPVT
jgi:hypothetical protein